MRWRYIGAMEDSSIVTNPASPILGPGSANYFDLILGYSLPTDTRLSLVVSNLLDRQPEQVGQNAGVTNASVYTLLGRTYLLTIDQKF
jgi:outer membrane receptor protein involved in Fe transport